MLQILISADPQSKYKKNSLKQTPFDLLQERIKQANPYEKNLEDVKEVLWDTLNTHKETKNAD